MAELELGTLAILKQFDGRTLRCGFIGSRLFLDANHRGTAPFARVTGKIVRRLEAKGFATWGRISGSHHGWHLTSTGRTFADARPETTSIGRKPATPVYDDIGKRKCTEFEIQAYLWAELRNSGYKVRGEFPFYAVEDNTPRRADLVVFLGKAKLAIEVKADRVRHNPKQMKNYRKCDYFDGVISISGQRHAQALLVLLKYADRQWLDNCVMERGARWIGTKLQAHSPGIGILR